VLFLISLFFRWLQEAFDVPLVIQLTDDEKFLWKNITIEESMMVSQLKNGFFFCESIV
jgi:hypothetical protein